MKKMAVVAITFAVSGLFLAVLGYGIWHDIKEAQRLERLKQEREARRVGTI